MSEKLAFLISSATLPEFCVTPLVHALAGRALEAEVEIHFAGPAVRMLVDGQADLLYATPEKEKSIGDFLRELQHAGATLYACSMAQAQWLAAGEVLLPGCQSAGATAFIARALADDWQTLIY
ncbi:MAG: peroxiredoxin [Proteobacteria bacterium]|nr:peroxiredoxin [Pseudomonadota bacterium]